MGVDVLATMSPDEYRNVKAQLVSEGLWQVGGNPVQEARSNKRAVEYLTQNLRSSN